MKLYSCITVVCIFEIVRYVWCSSHPIIIICFFCNFSRKDLIDLNFILIQFTMFIFTIVSWKEHTTVKFQSLWFLTSAASCTVAFHASCAHYSGLQMHTELVAGVTKYVAYCPKHQSVWCCPFKLCCALVRALNTYIFGLLLYIFIFGLLRIWYNVYDQFFYFTQTLYYCIDAYFYFCC